MSVYDLILADPPWHFQNYSGDTPEQMVDRGRGASRHYPALSLDSICALPVAAHAAPDSVLLLWACWPLLPEALQVIEAWGFTYKTLAWVWTEANPTGFGFHMGMGYWTRANSEPCLLATRGAGLPRLRRDVLGLIYSSVRAHSRKPDEQYDKIDRLFGPHLRRLELFARRREPGWDVYGNEAPESIELT